MTGKPVHGVTKSCTWLSNWTITKKNHKNEHMEGKQYVTKQPMGYFKEEIKNIWRQMKAKTQWSKIYGV